MSNTPKLIPTSGVGIIQKISPLELHRFNLPVMYDLFQCDDATGSFIQLSRDLTRAQMDDALKMFVKTGETKSMKIFACEVTRVPVQATFNVSSIGLRVDAGSDQING